MPNKNTSHKGRKSKMTPERIAQLETAWSLDATDSEACLLADITLKTLYTYQQQHPEFVIRKQLLKSTQVLKARTAVNRGLESEDVRVALDAGKWYLEHKRSGEFSTKEKVEVSGKVDMRNQLRAEIAKLTGVRFTDTGVEPAVKPAEDEPAD